MHIDDFDYELPPELIATRQASPRDHSRLLVVKSDRTLDHRHFFDIEEYLRPNDCLVLNETKVLPARLYGVGDDGREYETLLLSRLGPLVWSFLVKPGKKVKEQIRIRFPENVSVLVDKAPLGEMTGTFENISVGNFLEWLEKHGKPPLPPYIERETDASDVENYQTVFAKNPGSVAAPTAGLHFTDELLDRLRDKGVSLAKVTLHVGYGTFSPIRRGDIANHRMHTEEYVVPEETSRLLESTKKNGGRVFAVGTTALRALESRKTFGDAGATNLFITPGYQFSAIDGLLTNFHLPKSTLYVLVSSLLGIDKTRAIYEEAISRRYRFFSFGDAMLILP